MGGGLGADCQFCSKSPVDWGISTLRGDGFGEWSDGVLISYASEFVWSNNLGTKLLLSYNFDVVPTEADLKSLIYVQHSYPKQFQPDLIKRNAIEKVFNQIL